MSKHTPGPWIWDQRNDGTIWLCTPDRGRLIVMDFVRRGMGGAQPRFAIWQGDERARMGGIMTPAVKLDVAKHPDAALIAAAPELLAALEDLIQRFGHDNWESVHDAAVIDYARKVVAKAKCES